MTEFLFAYVIKIFRFLSFRNVVFDNDLDGMVVCCLTEDFIGFFNFTEFEIMSYQFFWFNLMTLKCFQQLWSCICRYQTSCYIDVANPKFILVEFNWFTMHTTVGNCSVYTDNLLTEIKCCRNTNSFDSNIHTTSICQIINFFNSFFRV